MRRLAALVAALALLGGAVSLAVSMSIAGSAGITYYQCVNAHGVVETSRAGTTKPTCGNKSDPIVQWPATIGTPPPPSTSSPPATTTSVVATTSSSNVTTTSVVAPGLWRPSSSASISWNWQLQGPISTASPPKVFDFDGFDNSATTVDALHAQGTIAICYIDVGTNEPDRPDSKLFPPADNGSPVEGFTTEHWLDIRDVAGLEPIVRERMQMCAAKHFDAVEPDDVDAYANSSGFPLTSAQQLTYNRMVAAEAHAAGLSVGLKNDLDQVAALEPSFEWALDEQCNEFSECGSLAPFTAAGKAVFNAEYKGSASTFCAADAAKHVNGGKFVVALDGSGHSTCPAW